MRASFLFKLVAFVPSFVLVAAGGPGSDYCGECHGILQVPHHSTGKYTSVGNINACLCLSSLPNYVATNSLTISATAIGGKDAVIASLTAMIKSGNHGPCKYPAHSQPQCRFGNPCGFTCTDGYSPYPYSHPTECICPKPYTICNGRCGLFKGCPSQYHKRAELAGSYGLKCQKGLTSCPIPGRGGEYFECVDTQNDLESCGGCVSLSLPAYGYYSIQREGVDCSALPGVSDVSCVYGKCIVHKCSYGYSLDKEGQCAPSKGYYA